nr:inositol monophosphatase family protein [Jiangella asiatica]
MPVTDWEVAIAAAEAGAAVVLRRYGQPLARLEKSPTDFATAADVESEQAVIDVLGAARPGDAVVGEESGRTGDPHAERTWLVDPLCGTLNYAARTTLVAVNVALRLGADVDVGVSADPFAGEVFWADGGRA